jgi:hypothetical protein
VDIDIVILSSVPYNNILNGPSFFHDGRIGISDAIRRNQLQLLVFTGYRLFH